MAFVGDSPMTSGGDEIEHHMNAVIPESRVTLDARLLGQNVIVLSLEIANNLCETAPQNQPGVIISFTQRDWCLPRLVVDFVTKSRSIDNRQRDTSTLLVQLKLWTAQSVSAHRVAPSRNTIERTDSDRLDLDALFGGRIADIVALLVLQNALAAKRVDERSSA